MSQQSSDISINDFDIANSAIRAQTFEAEDLKKTLLILKLIIIFLQITEQKKRNHYLS